MENWHNISVEQTLHELVSRNSGLTEDEVKERLQRFGHNELTSKKKAPAILVLGRQCDTRPRSRTVDALNQEFSDRVLTYVHLDDGWKTLVGAALQGDREVKGVQVQQDKLLQALGNLRKQHLWGDISDDDYRRERTALERQLKLITPDHRTTQFPNLERAAQLLNDLPALWSHPGVTNEQREALGQEVFTKITVDGKTLVAIEPRPAYAPLFAAILARQPLGYRDLESPPSPPTPTSLDFL